MDKYKTFTNYINNNEVTPNEEDYLEMIYRLKTNSKVINNKAIANCLNIKPSSVTKMIDKLSKKGFVTHDSFKQVFLTAKGEIVGAKLYEKHILIERFLKLIGIEDGLLELVEKIEHTIDDAQAAHFARLIGFFDSYEPVKEMFNDYIRKH